MSWPPQQLCEGLVDSDSPLKPAASTIKHMLVTGLSGLLAAQARDLDASRPPLAL